MQLSRTGWVFYFNPDRRSESRVQKNHAEFIKAKAQISKLLDQSLKKQSQSILEINQKYDPILDNLIDSQSEILANIEKLADLFKKEFDEFIDASSRAGMFESNGVDELQGSMEKIEDLVKILATET